MKNGSNPSTFSPVRMETRDLIALAVSLAGARGNARQTADSSKPKRQQVAAVAHPDMATWGG
ncbi:MAG: hypothetical protein LC126_08285 [Bryobacterales bacterium]|nr:hypothetical protein [Bryobacterales bacterium]